MSKHLGNPCLKREKTCRFSELRKKVAIQKKRLIVKFNPVGSNSASVKRQFASWWSGTGAVLQTKIISKVVPEQTWEPPFVDMSLGRKHLKLHPLINSLRMRQDEKWYPEQQLLRWVRLSVRVCAHSRDDAPDPARQSAWIFEAFAKVWRRACYFRLRRRSLVGWQCRSATSAISLTLTQSLGNWSPRTRSLPCTHLPTLPTGGPYL